MVDRGDDPAPALAAALRDLPTVSRVLDDPSRRTPLEVLRKSDRGGRQRVRAPLPCALLVAGEAREVGYPPLEAVMASLEAKVEVWGLPELGLPEHAIGKAGSYLEAGRFITPRPDPIRVVTPDANAPRLRTDHLPPLRRHRRPRREDAPRQRRRCGERPHEGLRLSRAPAGGDVMNCRLHHEIRLVENGQGSFLVREIPLAILRVNGALASLVKRLRADP